MPPDPLGDCFFPKKSVRMLGKTRDCPLSFNAWVAYSFLWWKRRYDEGVTAKTIAKFTGLHRSSTVRRALERLQGLRLASKTGRLWWALQQPVEPTGEIKHYKMGEWVQIVPGPQPLKPWFASKKHVTVHRQKLAQLRTGDFRSMAAWTLRGALVAASGMLALLTWNVGWPSWKRV